MNERARPGARSVRRPPGRSGGSDGRAAAGWLLPALLVAVVLLGGSMLWQLWRGDGVTRPPEPSALARRSALAPVRIEVLNGSGEPGAAAKLASSLREGGFNVVSVGSADRYDYLRTLVVERTDNDRGAAAVGQYLGEVIRIRQRARSEADVTVIVGRDRGRLPWGEGKEPRKRG